MADPALISPIEAEVSDFLDRHARYLTEEGQLPTNGAALKAFYYYVERIWLRTLRRRSQKDRFSGSGCTGWPPTGITLESRGKMAPRDFALEGIKDRLKLLHDIIARDHGITEAAVIDIEKFGSV